jgi:hypothetical protein|tara:strand:+ start:400 stop:1140 length:741 start_codon:yes stop_codon:yes gene_type:complete
MARGFFKQIPNIQYDFKSDGKFFEAKDLFRKVSTWSYLQEGISGYTYYRVTEGERPDVVSSKLYGDSTLYWTFFLVNENLQDFNDWPKSGQLLHRFIARKYSGKVLVGSESTDIVSFDHATNVSSKFLLGEKVTQTSSGAFGFVTKIDPTHNRIVLNSVEGTFTTGTVVGSDSSKSFTVTSVADEKDVVHHYTDSNGLRTTVSTSNTPVSNEEYERDINEDKFNIRIIEPRYIDKVVTEFNRLVRD